MKILHICNDYCYSKVHSELYAELDKLGVEQVVYAYPIDRSRAESNRFDGKYTEFISADVLRPYHRYLFHIKIRDIANDVCQRVDMTKIDCINATTLFSDGGVAYALHKIYGIPYMVAVRNTDVNAFLNWAPHTWKIGMNVLLHSARIVFISKALMKSFCKHIFIRMLLKRIENKFILQPNGIDTYWITHVERGEKPNNHNLIYVGRFDTNKNVKRLLKAVLSLRAKFPDIQMHLVGGGDTRHDEVMKVVNDHTDIFHFHGKIHDKERLREMYRLCSIFAMTSFYETFGLVYLEALSQNLAVVYTRYQGIDGLLDARVGESVDAFSKKSIANAIERIFNNREKYMAHEVIDFTDYQWDRIALLYHGLLNDVIKNIE